MEDDKTVLAVERIVNEMQGYLNDQRKQLVHFVIEKSFDDAYRLWRRSNSEVKFVSPRLLACRSYKGAVKWTV